LGDAAGRFNGVDGGAAGRFNGVDGSAAVAGRFSGTLEAGRFWLAAP